MRLWCLYPDDRVISFYTISRIQNNYLNPCLAARTPQFPSSDNFGNCLKRQALRFGPSIKHKKGKKATLFQVVGIF
jgi:hypothetical protein